LTIRDLKINRWKNLEKRVPLLEDGNISEAVCGIRFGEEAVIISHDLNILRKIEGREKLLKWAGIKILNFDWCVIIA
jgi:hypothetical protein